MSWPSCPLHPGFWSPPPFIVTPAHGFLRVDKPFPSGCLLKVSKWRRGREFNIQQAYRTDLQLDGPGLTPQPAACCGMTLNRWPCSLSLRVQICCKDSEVECALPRGGCFSPVIAVYTSGGHLKPVFRETYNRSEREPGRRLEARPPPQVLRGWPLQGFSLFFLSFRQIF